MADSTYWDAVVRRLKEIEKDWMPPRPSVGIQTSDSRPMLRSGILTSSDGWGGGVMRAMPGYQTAMDSIRRVTNVTNAINDSFPAAFGEIERGLGGISLNTIEDVLRNMLKDVAIILGGSTVVGTGIGAAAGAFAFGIGAVPGAAVGASAGFEMGNLILTFTGLKSVVSFMAGAVPAAIQCYGKGFRDAWGERDDLRTPWANFAYKSFAKGHVLFVMAILMGIVGYLLRGKGDFPMLLGEIRLSPKLGPKFADWIVANKDALIRNPTLQQGVRASAGAAGEEASVLPSQVQGPIRGQQLSNVVNPDTVLPTMRTPAQIGGEGRYGDLKNSLDDGYQAHHLNQNAAFKSIIPKDDGFSVGLSGNAFTEPGTPHYDFHTSLENFWNQYRSGGELYGNTPSCSEYGDAVTQALDDAGVTPTDAQRLSDLAAQNRAAFGLEPADPVPRIPGRIYQSGGEQ